MEAERNLERVDFQWNCR